MSLVFRGPDGDGKVLFSSSSVSRAQNYEMSHTHTWEGYIHTGVRERDGNGELNSRRHRGLTLTLRPNDPQLIYLAERGTSLMNGLKPNDVAFKNVN